MLDNLLVVYRISSLEREDHSCRFKLILNCGGKFLASLTILRLTLQNNSTFIVRLDKNLPTKTPIFLLRFALFFTAGEDDDDDMDEGDDDDDEVDEVKGYSDDGDDGDYPVLTMKRTSLSTVPSRRQGYLLYDCPDVKSLSLSRAAPTDGVSGGEDMLTRVSESWHNTEEQAFIVCFR